LLRATDSLTALEAAILRALEVAILLVLAAVILLLLGAVTSVLGVLLLKFLAAAIKVLLNHHRSSLHILGRCSLARVMECLGADNLLPLVVPSYRRNLVHPAVYLLNPQVKICRYYLV